MRCYVKKLRSVRNGKTFIPYNSYTPEDLNSAVADVNNKRLTLNKASQLYKIPKATLSRKCRKLNSSQEKAGHPTLFTVCEEKSFINYMKILSEWGFPFDVMDLRILAQKYLNKIGKKMYNLKDNMPGPDWARNFLLRHRDEISSRTASNIATDRAKLSPEILDLFFENWAQTVAGVDSSRIINYDETNLTDDPGTKKYIFRRGIKYPERIMNSSKTAVSLMFSATASGMLLPTYVVYKAEHLWDTWLEGGPKDTYYNRSKSGWFDSVCFEDWFNSIIVPYAKKQNGEKVVVIGDNLSSHFSDNVFRTCEELNIAFACLPPKSTHLLQPLDVALYGPLKNYWRQILTSWKELEGRKHKTLVKSCFPRLLTKLQTKLSENDVGSKNIIAGFKTCGLYPVNSEIPKSRLPQSSMLLEEINTTTASVITEMLKEMRGVSAPQTQTRRKKKVQVPPGKGIKIDDILPAEPKKIAAKKNKSKVKQAKKTRSVLKDLTSDNISNLVGDNDESLLPSDSSNVIDISGVDFSAAGPSGLNQERQNKVKNATIIPRKRRMSPVKTKKGKGIGKKSRVSEKENSVRNSQQTVKAPSKKKNRQSSSCSTSVTDCISLHSDSDITDIFEDFDMERNLGFRNIFSDNEPEDASDRSKERNMMPEETSDRSKEIYTMLEEVNNGLEERTMEPEEAKGIPERENKEPEKEERNKELEEVSGISEEGNKQIEGASSISEERNKELEGARSILEKKNNEARGTSEERTKDTDMINDLSNDKNMESKEILDNLYQKKAEELEISPAMNDYINESYDIKQNVLVRYYNRKKWTYYVGFIEKREPESVACYEIMFYKTQKKPLRFVCAKRPERDVVPALSIVKKIHLTQDPHNLKMYLLSNEEDAIYF